MGTFPGGSERQPAGVHFLLLKMSAIGRRLVQRLKACKGTDRQEELYGEMYQWARSNIYVMMGGEADGIPKYFRTKWEAILLPGAERLDREAVEDWIRQLAKMRSKDVRD